MGAPMVPTDERELLCGFLDWNRVLAARKVEGLDRDGATRVVTPSGVTALGIITHLTVIEARWFRLHLRGEPDEGMDAATSFSPPADLTVEAAVAAYRAECERSRRAMEGLGLDAESVVPQRHFGTVTLRWILVHMIEETARHLGHMDVLRELTDGHVGDR